MEVLLAMGIVILIAAGATFAVMGSFSLNRLGDEETEATLFAQEGIEAARSIKNQGWDVPFVSTRDEKGCSDGCGLDTPSGYWRFSDSPGQNTKGKFTRQITVVDISRDGDGAIVESGGTDDPNTKKVTSAVNWNFTVTRPNAVTLTTYLTYWEKTLSSDSAVAYWSLDEDEGDIAHDCMGGNDGDIVGGTWVTGQYNSAVQFRYDNDRIVVQDDDTLDLAEEGTIMSWLRVRTPKVFAGLVHKGEQIDWSDEAYSFQFWSPASILSIIIYNQVDPGYLKLESNQQLKTRTWYHVAASWDMERIYLYVNGEEDNSTPNTIGAVRRRTGDLIIGAQLKENYDPTFKKLALDGIMDEVAIYNRRLSEEEIEEIYLNGFDLCN